MKALKGCPGTEGTIRDFLAIPGNAENVRERFYRDARRIGFTEADADDAAQFAFVMMMQSPDITAEGERIDPVRAFYRVRKWCRRTGYKGANGYQRDARRKLLAPLAEATAMANMRAGMMADNPAAIAAAIESAEAGVSRAMGRNAAAIRGMTADDIRSLAMPDMRGLAEREPGECPRVVDTLPGACKPDNTPRHAMPGDGTEWRGCGLEWTEMMPADGHVSRCRHWLRLVG